MKKFVWLTMLLLLVFESSAYADNFVKVDGTDFYLNGKPFYFAGTNNYYLRYGNPDCIAYDPNGGCTKEVLDDAYKMNLSVIRTWGFTDGNYYWGSLQPYPGEYDEENFRKMDLLIREASDRNIKLIIPLVNNWNEYGGMCKYVIWCGLSGSCDPNSASSNHDLFYTDECARELFKNYTAYFLNRTNTLTGIKYRDDPTIMAWELANEPRAKSDTTGQILNDWIENMSVHIKSIDSNHLLTTGEEGFYLNKGGGGLYDGSEGTDFISNHNHTNIDFASFHLYPDHWSMSKEQSLIWIEEHINDSKLILGKPVVMGEFGKMGSPEPRLEFMSSWYNLSESKELNGNLLWELVDKAYPWDNDFGINYPEDAYITNIVTDDSNYWKEYNNQLSPSNNAPQIQPIDDIIAYEGQIVTITVNSDDSDGDYIFYSINDSYHFNKNANVFTWQTNVGDSNNYTFLIKATDGITEKSVFVNLNLLPNDICMTPYDNMIITSDTTFCKGSYNLPNGISVGSNVLLDCNGSEIIGPGNSNQGITVGGSNSVIKNCTIKDYQRGIYMINAQNITIINNLFTSYIYHGINMQSSNNNVIENNTFLNNVDIGSYCYHSQGNIIRGNNFTYNGKGVYFDGCKKSIIANNYFYNSHAGAVYLLIVSDNNTCSDNIMKRNGLSWSQGGGFSISISDNNIIANNDISDGYQGIFLEASTMNNLTNNKMKNNYHDFYVHGGDLISYIHYIDSSNIINDNPIIYLVNSNNPVISKNSSFIGLINSTDANINNINNNYSHKGILFAYTTNSKIENSVLYFNSKYGISIDHSNNVKIRNNRLTSYGPYVLDLDSSNNSLIENNLINYSSGFGLYMYDSYYQNMTKNNLTGAAIPYFGGSTLNSYNHTIDTSNSINGVPIYYYFGRNNYNLENVKAALVLFAYSDNITVKNVSLINKSYIKFAYVNNSSISNSNLVGDCYINLFKSNNNTVYSNSVSGKPSRNGIGINVDDSNENIIEKNNITDNNQGLSLDSSDNNDILSNYISRNSEGIHLWNSQGNFFSFNIITNNSGGIYIIQSKTTLEHNNIYSNNPYSNINSQIYNSSAKYNWWGSVYCGDINDNIFDCKDGGISYGCVDYSIILDAPYPDGKPANCSLFRINCSNNQECGTDAFVGGNFCSSKNVSRNYLSFACNNLGTKDSFCSNSTQPIIIDTCRDYCSNGACMNFTCHNNSECNDNNASTQDICVNPSTVNSTCQHNSIKCSSNSQCGTNGWVGGITCSNNDTYQNYITYTCNNPGTGSSYCSNSTVSTLKQDCGVTTYDAWSANACEGNNVIKTRTVHNKGCSGAACYANDSTEKQTVQTCLSNGLYCDGNERCSAGACVAGTAVDCSANNLNQIATCSNNPDNNPLTWDYFAGFTSTCDETNDRCTTGAVSLTHACSKTQCGAQCANDSDCSNGLKCNSSCSCFNPNIRRPFLEWQPVAGATQYYLWINKDGQKYLTTLVQSSNWLADRDFKSGDYIYWIRPIANGNYIGPWSQAYAFKVNGALPAQTTLLSPLNDVNIKPTFSWQQVSDSSWYYLLISKDGAEYLKKWVQGQTTYFIDNLSLGSYEWKVQTWNVDGFGPLSNTVEFSYGKSVPITPFGTTNKRPLFSWSNVDSATWYYLWINKDGSKYDVRWINGKTTYTPVSDLPAGNYQWWVRSWNSAGYGPWSDAMGFKIE